MNDDPNPKSSNVPDAIDAVAGLAKAVPIYDDAFKPLMQETGKALSTLGKTVNIALAPIRGFVWGAEAVEKWISTKLTEKLEGTPPEDIVTPDLAIAGPTIEALKFNGHKPELSEMFAGLMAGAMKKSTAAKAHPTFVDKIRSMTALEAQLFAHISQKIAVPTLEIQSKTTGISGVKTLVSFVNDDFRMISNTLGIPQKDCLLLIQSSIENLQDLGLIHAKTDGHLTSPTNLEAYKLLEQGQTCQEFRMLSFPEGQTLEVGKSYLVVTQTGKHFREVVLS